MTESGTYDQATILRKQKIADAMLGDATKPQKIEHWAQGLAQLARAGVGGYLGNQANEEAKASKAQDMAALASLLGGGPPPAPTPSAAPSTAPIDQMLPGGRPAEATASPSKVYSQDEPNPMDIPTGQDRTRMIATILGEAGNQGPTGQNAVASVIRNRAVNGGYGGDTPSAVVTAPNQFEPWNTEAGRAKMNAAASDPAQAAAADRAIDMAYAGNDPTNGAKNFISPKVQTALGRSMPAWAQGPGQDIGDHRFFGGAPQSPTQAPYQVAGPPTAAPQAPVAQAMAAPQMPATPSGGLLANATPQQRQAIMTGMAASEGSPARAVATAMMSNLAKADGPTDDIKEFNAENALRAARGEPPLKSILAMKEQIKKAGKPETTVNVGGGSDKQIFDAMEESAKGARTTAAGLTGLREARAAIEGGAITGQWANEKLALQKVGALFGADSSKIVNTETFRSAIAPQVAAMLKSTVGTTNISNTDREFAEKAAGGNITLDEKSITRLLGIMERASTAQLTAHQKRLETVYADPEKYKRERALFGVDMPAAPPMVQPAPTKSGPAVPAAGEIRDGYRFKGGNPADPKSWEQIT